MYEMLQLTEQDLMNYYTVVPEMSHKDSELQILITNGNLTWRAVGDKDHRKVPDLNNTHDVGTASNVSLVDSLSETNDDDVELPTLRNINMQLSKVRFLLYIPVYVLDFVDKHHSSDWLYLVKT